VESPGLNTVIRDLYNNIDLWLTLHSGLTEFSAKCQLFVR